MLMACSNLQTLPALTAQWVRSLRPVASIPDSRVSATALLDAPDVVAQIHQAYAAAGTLVHTRTHFVHASDSQVALEEAATRRSPGKCAILPAGWQHCPPGRHYRPV